MAKRGDVSVSACATSFEDMCALYQACISGENLTNAQRRAGVVRYVRLIHLSLLFTYSLTIFKQCVYLFAWLLLERLNETLTLNFTNIDVQKHMLFYLLSLTCFLIYFSF